MKTFLIHTRHIGGHQLEYIHHLYIGATCHKEHKFVFVLPKRFESDSSCFDWPQSSNIVLKMMSDGEEPPSNSGLLRKAWINSKVLGKYATLYGATDVIVISIMEYLPFVPFFLGKGVRLSGIVYRIYLYDWYDESLFMKMQDLIKYWIMSHFKVFHRVYMCNDSVSALCLNRIFSTKKYCFLPDPVASIRGYQGKNIRRELAIPELNYVFLHPGSMNTYKNTIGILKALKIMEEPICRKITVILAGQLSADIKHDLYKLYPEVSQKVQIILKEGYLSFEILADLFVSSDYVLAPYTVKSQSSGIVGHAAYYGKPVIAVKGGMIGKIVRKWHLGFLLDSPSETSICKLLSRVVNEQTYSTKGNSYPDTHSVESFINTLLQ